MAAAAREWSLRHPETTVDWEARPLAAFNDQPIAEAVSGYDLVFVDHPAIAEAVATGCLTALDGLLPAAELAALAADSIAASHHTYHAADHQWALGVDAACQVAVADGEWLDQHGPAPRTWEDVLKLARAKPGGVALPLYPSDAICSLLSISAGEARAAARTPAHAAPDAPPSMPEDPPASHAPPSTSEASPAPGGIPTPCTPALVPRALITPALITPAAVEVLADLAAHVDPRSFDLNPPGMLDLMAGAGQDAPDDAPVYVPLLFGYTDYQRPGAPGRLLRFHDAPTVDGRPGGTVLGGAGLAVPATSRWPRRAAEFAAWVAGSSAQRAVVCPHGGQPASAAVWADDGADALVGGFLSGTRATMEAAYVRPATRWWPRFQEAAGLRLAALLREGASPSRIHTALVRILDQHRHEE